jgi:5'-methylthioadenosine phosphorylase
MKMTANKLGVIGGTGLYDIEGLTNIKSLDLDTPFGKPSDEITTGELGDTMIAFLPRHGKGHTIPPSEIPSLANIYALKMIGVKQIIAFNAVGSLREDIRPGNIVIPDQFIDKTTRRPSTFFGKGLVAHISFIDPVCPSLSKTVMKAATKTGADVHFGGTYVVMEGPAFSTRAESLLHRSWGAHVIGMTALPEAKLAREAGICYSTIACVTDYDCWHESEESVSIEMIKRIQRQHNDISKNIVRLVALDPPSRESCQCASALKNTVLTHPEYIDAKYAEDLKPIIGDCLGT